MYKEGLIGIDYLLMLFFKIKCGINWALAKLVCPTFFGGDLPFQDQNQSSLWNLRYLCLDWKFFLLYSIIREEPILNFSSLPTHKY